MRPEVWVQAGAGAAFNRLRELGIRDTDKSERRPQSYSAVSGNSNRNSPLFGSLDEQGAAPLLQVVLSRTLYLGLLQAAAGILRIISRR